MKSFRLSFLEFGSLASWLTPVLSVTALVLAGLGQASLAGVHLPRWLSAPYSFVFALLLLILATSRYQRDTAMGLRRWLLPITGLAVAILCVVLAVSQFRQSGGFATGLLLAGLGIAVAGAAFGSLLPTPSPKACPEHSRRAGRGGAKTRLGLAEAGLLLLAVATVAAAILLWWRGEKPNLAFVLNAIAFLCILWIALRLDRRFAETPRNTQHTTHNTLFEWLALGLILVSATFLRTYRLLDMPYGVWYDEGEAGLEAVEIYEGVPFSPMGRYSPNNPSLFFYLAAAGFKLLGPNLYTLRLVTAAIGVATVGVAYLLFRLILGRQAALIAAGLLAASSWHVNFSRIGMGYITLAPFFEVTTLYFLVRGLRQVRWTDFVLGGLMLGLGLYSHTSFRLFPLAVVIYVLYDLISQRPERRRRFARLVVMGVVSLMVFAPQAVWAIKHRDAYSRRMAQTSFLVGHDTPQSAIRVLENNVEKHALMFNLRGDHNGRHNLPDAPQLDAISAALFALGVGYSLYRWRTSYYFLLVTWFIIAMLAGVLSLWWEAPQAARTIGAIPAVYGLAAVPLALAWQSFHDKGRVPAVLATLAIGILLLAAFYLNYDRCFNQQYQNADVFHAFSTPDAAIARYVQAVGEERYQFYLQNQLTPVYRFLTYHPGGGVDRREEFFRAVDHLPVRGAVERDVMYVLEPWRVALPLESFLRYYPLGVYEEIEDPFGKTMFYSFSVRKEDVDAMPGLVGRYYVGGDLTDEPQLTRRDATVAFDWRGENPFGQEPFSVAWEGTIFIPLSGTYALGTRSAGPSQVRFDGELIVDNPGQRDETLRVWETLRVTKGWHSLEINCLDCAGGPMELYWRVSGEEPEIVPQEALSIVPLPSNGLLGKYYRGTDWAGLPAFQEVDPVISFRWHDDPLPVPWCAQWEGKIRLQEGGEYRFKMKSNDYAALYIDGRQVVEYPFTPSGSTQLEAGEHEILVKYSNTKYYSEMRLFWTPPGGSASEAIPTEVLFP
jgi:4-amino-4-deoxy-L-arabinose transferase-like glycosyltransferase